jgi:hypothetical protein
MPPSSAGGSLIVLGLTLAALVAGRIYNVIVSPREKSKRRLVGTPRTVTGELQTGMARVTGKARRGRELLRAPLTHRPCLAYDFRVEVTSGDDWREVVHLREAGAFVVADEGGEALVEPGLNYELVLSDDVLGGTGWTDREPDPELLKRVVAMLDESEGPTDSWFNPRHVRYFEAALLEGELVSVYGAVIEEVHPDAERSGPRSLPVARVLRGTAEEPVRIGDGDVAADGMGIPYRA